MFCGSGGSKSRLAKPAAIWADERWKIARRCGAKHISKSTCSKRLSLGALLEVKMLKKCMLLWRGTHFEVKMYKAPQPRSTFGSWDVEKVHAVVARSTFRSQNVQNTASSRHFWALKRRFVWQAQATDSAPCQKWGKRQGFIAVPETMASVGHLKGTWKDAFRVAGTIQEICSSEMLGGRALLPWESLYLGADLQVCKDDFAWQVQLFVRPGIPFAWQAQHFTQMEWKNREMQWYEAVSSALNCPFCRTSRRIA